MTTTAEIAFEYLALALEPTRGTAVTPPTHYLPLAGTLTPVREKYRPEESRGIRAKNSRSKTVRTSGEWECEGGADPNYLPLIYNMVVKGGVTSPTTPVGATLSRLWTFVPTMNADNIKTATLFFGDPNVQIWRAAFTTVDEMTIASDSSGTDGVTCNLSGVSNFPTRVSAPTLPAQNVGDLLMPGAMQLWMDTNSAFGTTEITGRVISTEWTVPTGATYKYIATGPGGSLNYSRIGREKTASTAKIVVELSDDSIALGKEYQLFENDTLVKMRIRLNGGAIETVGPTTFYYYTQLDIYGPLDSFAWGDMEGTNRTMEFSIESQIESGLGADWALYVQNALTSL
jgi:hypothetical protein